LKRSFTKHVNDIRSRRKSNFSQHVWRQHGCITCQQKRKIALHHQNPVTIPCGRRPRN
jgi:hypothetical protein